MFKRYGIVDGAMLERGAAKLNEYLQGQKKRPAKVVSIGVAKAEP
jgi:hypothetical protein